jgi:outer membrane protein assembly factor BamB
MVRTVIKIAGTLLIVGLLGAGVVYFVFNPRVELDGGGMPHLRFGDTAAAQAQRIERHRAAQRQLDRNQESGIGNQRAGIEERTRTAASSESGPAAAEATATAPAAPGSTAPAYWTDFRGPTRDGVYRQGPVRMNWPASGLTPIWKQPVGLGYASFVVARGRAFTIEQRGPNEVVAAYDVPTGREVWTNSWPAEFRESMGGDGPRATPTWADGRVYALGATGELRALDERRGTMIWRTNILSDNEASNLAWGMAAAPLVVGDAVIVLPGGPNNKSVVAYHRVTGKRLWSALNEPQAYSSPALVTLLDVPQLVIFGGTKVFGLSLDGSKELWSYPWTTTNGINATQPLIIGDNRVFVSSSYGVGAAVIELTKDGDRFAVREVWRNTRMKNRFASSVLYNGVIYGLDEAILAAVDAETGALKWKGGRYGYGQLLLADGHLIVLTEDGDLVLVRANPDRHEELARFHVLDGKTWNVPALDGGYLLVRNLAEMAAFDLKVVQ